MRGTVTSGHDGRGMGSSPLLPLQVSRALFAPLLFTVLVLAMSLFGGVLVTPADALVNFQTSSTRPAVTGTTRTKLECYSSTGSSTIVAGGLGYCNLRVTTSGNVLIGDGDAGTICQLELTMCTTQRLNVNNTFHSMKLKNATFLSTGQYRFVFYPTVAATYSMVVRIRTASGDTGVLLVTASVPSNGNMTVTPSTVVDYTKSGSECFVNTAGGNRACAVVQRDKWGNYISSVNTSHTAAQDGREIARTTSCNLPDV